MWAHTIHSAGHHAAGARLCLLPASRHGKKAGRDWKRQIILMYITFTFVLLWVLEVHSPSQQNLKQLLCLHNSTEQTTTRTITGNTEQKFI